jgi:hypothetical protein
VIAAGGAIVEVLASDLGAQPTRAELDTWINTYQLPCTSVKDVDSAPLATLNALQRREISYVIDLSDMLILEKIVGTTDGTGASSTSIAMQDMLKRLGK